MFFKYLIDNITQICMQIHHSIFVNTMVKRKHKMGLKPKIFLFDQHPHRYVFD